MAGIINMAPQASKAPCPITKLPRELREMIYDYYFEAMETKCAKLYKPQFGDCLDENDEWSMWQLPRQTTNFQPLEPYLSMLHLSSGVRFETDMEIYEAAFSGVWFNFELDSDTNDVQRMKAMFAQIRNMNTTVKFGLHFTVCDHTPETFFQFVDSFFDIHTTGDNWAPAFVRCKEDSEARRLMHLSDKQHAGI
jgi:hypothetical protein